VHRSGVLEVPAEGTESANCPSLSPRVHTPLCELSRRSVGGVDFVVIWPYIVDPILFHVSAPFSDATGHPYRPTLWIATVGFGLVTVALAGSPFRHARHGD